MKTSKLEDMTEAPPTDRLEDENLLRQVVAGDAQAFTTLFRRRHPDVFRFAFHMTSSAAIADDVVQDVFLVLLRDASRYDAARATVAAWLCGIARNCVRQRLDRERRLEPLDADVAGHPAASDTDSDDPLSGLVRAERIAALRQAIATLPLPYREAVVLCELQELSYVDAAAALSCPVGTVRSRLHRARALLASRLSASSLKAAADTATVRPDRAGAAQNTCGATSVDAVEDGGCYA
jgi:RNA polymerase sigma-70 factor (ECF subfamily)